MAVWPVTLPQKPLKSGYGRSGKAVLIRSPMDSGPAKVRKRTNVGVKPVALAFKMTTAQVDDFEDWVVTDIGEGALSFTLPAPEADSGTIVVRMTGGAGSPLYDVTPSSPDMWIVSFAAEIMPS
jgi:hypothetical protein